MVKISAHLKRKPGMSPEEFQRYWYDVHRHLGSKLPGQVRYIQASALPAEYEGKDPFFDGIGDHYFENEKDLFAALQSPEVQAAIQDLENFTDTAANVLFFCKPREVKD